MEKEKQAVTMYYCKNKRCSKFFNSTVLERCPYCNTKVHEKVILMDANFLASPRWKEKLEYLIARRVKVNFNQGLDFRLVTEENARLLSKVKYYDWRFKKRRLHVAWDQLKDEKAIFTALEILSMYVPKEHIMCYVLVGFNTTLKQDIYRIQKLLEFDIKPFVMIYNNKPDPMLHRLARWINKRYYKVVDWRDFQKKERFKSG